MKSKEIDNIRLVLDTNNIFESSDYELVYDYEKPRIHVIGHLYHPHTRHDLRDMIYDTLREEEFDVKKIGKYWIEINLDSDVLSYGMKSVPKKDREYKMMNVNSPVGNIEEWKSFARDQGINKLIFLEQDGTRSLIVQNN
jgi:hypothetical protein